MKKTLFISAIALLAMVSCNQKQTSPFEWNTSKYDVVDIEVPDLSGISDNGKEVLNLYRFAADEVNDIYWKQYFGDKTSLLENITDSVEKTFVEINYGPWDRQNGKAFVGGYDDRTPGAGFYPSDMTAEEFEAYNNPDKNSPYTLIRRAEDGSLQTVWYHEAFAENIEKIANYLNAAADITIKPSVRNYLLSKIEALRTDKYYDSGIAWLDMNDSKMDLVIGPNEAADDQLMGLKRSYEAFVLLKNEARTNELMEFVSRIGDFQNDLPGEEAYKAFQPGAGSNIFSCDALYYAGKANAGVKVIALNLPFDTDVQRDKGTRTILLDNVIKAKYNNIIVPAAQVLLNDEATESLLQEAFYWNIVFREVAHCLGVKETVNGKGSVEKALAGAAPTLEEVKANTAGVLLVCQLQKHFDIHHIFAKKEALTTYFVSLVRSERFGEGSSLGRANIIIYNYLKEAGAFERKVSGKYTLNLEKMEQALSDLTALVLKIQATGDKEAADELEAKYSKMSADTEDDMRNLVIGKVPYDIRFNFKK